MVEGGGVALLFCHTLPNPSVSSGSGLFWRHPFWRHPTHLEARGSLPLHLNSFSYMLAINTTVLKAHPDFGLEGQTKSRSENANAYVHTLSAHVRIAVYVWK